MSSTWGRTTTKAGGLAAALLLAACATTASREEARVPPKLEPGVKGGIAWMRSDDYMTFSAAWTNESVTAGPRARPATGYFVRGPGGTWKTGVDVLEVSESRITGRNTDVAISRGNGGFRLTGVYGGQSVDLAVDARGARAHQITYTREASGAYVVDEAPHAYFFLVGEAARLEDPPWPEIALASLAANFGVKAW